VYSLCSNYGTSERVCTDVRVYRMFVQKHSPGEQVDHGEDIVNQGRVFFFFFLVAVRRGVVVFT
jgi:hypothetical protein